MNSGKNCDLCYFYCSCFFVSNSLSNEGKSQVLTDESPLSAFSADAVIEYGSALPL